MTARLALLFVLLAAIAAFVTFGGTEWLSVETLKARREALDAAIAAQPLRAAILFGLVYAAAVALSVPGAAVLTLAGGALFGLATGTVIASLASTAGATAAMLAARFIARDWVKRRFPDAVARIDRGISRDGAIYLLTLRLAPVFPFFLINLAMGLTAMPALRYAALTMAGALPGTLAYTYAGTALARVESPGDVLSAPILIAFLALAALPFAGRFAARRIARHKARPQFRKPDRFDSNLLIIGAGSAGLVAALVGTQLKARAILIERADMGGDCLNTGCVPSKSLLRAARAAAEVRDAGRFGVQAGPVSVDFAATMRFVRDAIATIAPNDSAERYAAMGVDVRRSGAKLIDPWTVELDDGTRLTGRHIVIASGAAPVVPDLPGLAGSGFVTSETLWDALSERDQVPDRTLIVGGGPIGCELGQALARLGSRVTIVNAAERLLDREDAEASGIVQARLEREGVTILSNRSAVAVQDGRLKLDDGTLLDFAMLVVAVGRAPRLSGLGLEALGIDPDSPLDRQRREPWPHILFAGDAAGEAQFTHFAGHSGAVAAINAVASPFARFATDTLVPRVTYTEPELASVGQVADPDGDIEHVTVPLGELDRAICEDSGPGLLKVALKPGTDRILGVTIVAPHAGENLLPWILAIKRRIGLKAMLSAIHPYPTDSEAGRTAAGKWRRAHRPERLLAWLGRWLAWRRGG